MATFGKIGARPLLLKNTGEYAEEQMYKELFLGTVERTGYNTGGYLDLTTPELTSIGKYAYSYHELLGKINLNNVVAVYNYAFNYAKIHGEISLPSCTVLGGDCFTQMFFYGGTISIPKVTKLTSRQFYQGAQAQRSNPKYVTVLADSCDEISGNAFYNGHGLKKLYAPHTSIISGSQTFLSVGGAAAVGTVELIVGSHELNTGLTTSALMAQSNFPFGASTSGRVTWYCKDGTVTYDTAQSKWVQNPYT